MAEVVIGAQALERRLAAISGPHAGPVFMRRAGGLVRGQMILNMRAAGARKTGLTAASIQVSRVTDNSALLTANAVAKYIDEGTGLYGPLHRKITPKAAKALRWMGGPAGSLRLTGSRRKGKAGAGAAWIYAKSTKGMKARPYVQKSIIEAGQKLGAQLVGDIVKLWNEAA